MTEPHTQPACPACGQHNTISAAEMINLTAQTAPIGPYGWTNEPFAIVNMGDPTLKLALSLTIPTIEPIPLPTERVNSGCLWALGIGGCVMLVIGGLAAAVGAHWWRIDWLGVATWDLFGLAALSFLFMLWARRRYNAWDVRYQQYLSACHVAEEKLRHRRQAWQYMHHCLRCQKVFRLDLPDAVAIQDRAQLLDQPLPVVGMAA